MSGGGRNMVSRTEGNIIDWLVGGYASAEVPKGKVLKTVITGVDIVLNHH